MKADNDRLERCAYLCRSIRDLTVDMERDTEEFASAMLLIREAAVSVHDELDAEIRRGGDPGIGFLCPLRAALDEKLHAATRKAADPGCDRDGIPL